jgi:hypothetical protein
MQLRGEQEPYPDFINASRYLLARQFQVNPKRFKYIG